MSSGAFPLGIERFGKEALVELVGELVASFLTA